MVVSIALWSAAITATVEESARLTYATHTAVMASLSLPTKVAMMEISLTVMAAQHYV